MKIRRFEHVTAGPATSLLRVDGKPPWRRATAQRPTLLIDSAGEPQRFAALPAPPDPRGLLRAAYSVPSTVIDAETRFWLEHPDGSLTELPQPTPGASRRDRTVADTPPPETAPPPDFEDAQAPPAPEAERRADVHAKLAVQSGALAESERAAAESEQARRLAEAELDRTRAEIEERVAQARASAEREMAESRAEAERARAEADSARADADRLIADLETATQERIAGAVAESDGRVAEADARAAAAEALLDEARNRVTEAEAAAGGAQSRVTGAESRAAEADARAAEAESRATQGEQRVLQAEQQAALAEQTAAEALERAQSAEAELGAAREHAQGLRTRTQELERVTSEQQERVESMDRMLAEKQPEQSALERELQALRSSRASVEQELDQARDQLRIMTFERDELTRQTAAFDGVAIKARERATKAEMATERLNETIEELQTWRGELERRLAATTSELGVAKAARQADERELKRLRELLADTGHQAEHVIQGAESSHTVAAQAAEIELLMAEVASLRAGHDPATPPAGGDPAAAGRIAALEAERAEIARRASELSTALAQVLEPARMLAEIAAAGEGQPTTGPEANLELVSRAAERTAREQAERELRAAARESSPGRRHPG
jgi:hypothetical protein